MARNSNIHQGLLYASPSGTHKTNYVFDSAQDKLFIETEQDVEGILEHNKLLYNSHSHPTNVGKYGEHVATIPRVIWDILIKEGIAWDDERLVKWLDDWYNNAFRTHPMRVGKNVRV